MRNQAVTLLAVTADVAGNVARAIADEVRRDILVMLHHGPMTAGAIARCFDISRPAVSRHLRVLREHGLVHDAESGRERLYRLDAVPLAELDHWLAQFRTAWDQRLDALETEVHRTRRDRRRTGRSEPRRSEPNHPTPPTRERSA
jgi:DNA-binding transcriptional ArsR family regulator